MSGGGHSDDPAEDLKKLFIALRTVAKEDDLSAARLPAEAYVPLAAEHRAAIADRILHAPGDVVSLQRRRRMSRRFLAIVIGPVAAAAALILVVRLYSGE